MPTLKVQCPDCDTPIRKTIHPVDEPTDFALTCPRCGNRFVASAEPEARPVSQAARKPARPARRRDDDEDDERPRKHKKKKAAAGPNTTLIAAGVGGGLLVVGAVVALVLVLNRPKDKEKEVARSEPQQQQPAPTPPPPSPGPINAGPVNPGPVNPGPVDPGSTNPGGPGTQPAPKDPDDGLPPGLKLPPPPKVRVSGSAAPKGGGRLVTDKLPTFPPPTPDEDPFIRALRFSQDGPLPRPPKLPPPRERPLLTLDPGGHTAFVLNVFITPKGDQVITVSEDKAVRIWDIKSGTSVHTIRLPAGVGSEGALHAAALSPDGKRLAVGGNPLKSVQAGRIPIFLINVETGTLAKTITAASHVVTCLDFSPDGSRIAAGCANGAVQVFSIASGNAIGQPLPAHPGAEVREIRYCPNRNTNALATLGGDGAVKFWDLINLGRSRTLDVSSLKPNAFDWMSDGGTLAVAGDSGDIALISVSDGRLAFTLPHQTQKGKTVQINRLQFLPGDREIAVAGVGGGSGWAGVFSIATRAPRVSVTANTNTIMGLGVSADGKLAVTSGGNQLETYVWSTADGKLVSRLCGTGNVIWGIGWAKDGKSVAWGTNNLRDQDGHTTLEGTFRLDDFGLGGPPDESRYDQSVSGDQKYVVKRVSKTEVAMGTLDGKLVAFSMPEGGQIYSATVLRNRGLAVVCGVASVRLVDIATGTPIREFIGHTGNITAVAPSPDGRYFVTGSSDQTIRVWQPDSEDPLLSIFVGGQEWIAWTPQGYYACSPHGEELIAWQVNGTPYRFPQVWPAARFRPALYQPALLKYLIPAGDLRQAMAMAEKFDKALVQTTSVADIIPPDVTIDSPAPAEGKDDPVVVNQDTFAVKASARSAKHPITAMRLLVDGRPFRGAAGVKRFDNPQVTAEATWEVPLVPGPHTFAVIAETGVSKNISKVATLRRTGEVPKPNLYFLAVGVSAYPKNKLNYAASDARLLTKAFQEKSTGVFAKIETKVLTDAEATRQNIRAGLDWLDSKMTPTDVGIVMFSGHGTRDLLGRFYLVPVDVAENDPERTCLSGDELKLRLGSMPGRLVAILDACHAGEVAEDFRPAKADSLAHDLASEDAGVIVMCSSLGREYSIESPLTKAGFYTLALVEGLSGHGDVDEDGVIYINELEMYAVARVRQLSEGRQNPTLGRQSSVSLFPVATVPKGKEKKP